MSLCSAPASSTIGLQDGTKKSFDFTDELKKLNDSGESDRLNFVENVFLTPANLRYDFDLRSGSVPGRDQGVLPRGCQQ
jgi:hypothetical protein